MSKKNDDFFEVKKPWSEVKDGLLGCYLKPYLQKVLRTGKPIVYVDCFAGKGVFKDGKPGSPIIALNMMRDCLAHTQVNRGGIKPYFIELNHASELSYNLSKYKLPEGNIINGKYQDEIRTILLKNVGSNIFLYIDPYGIKDLNHRFFRELTTSTKYNSVELLLNLNSYGFIREGCRVLGVNFEDETLLDELEEYETTKLEKNEKSILLLNEIAGGDYWQEIIQNKNRKILDTKEAENLFVTQYCKRLRQNYKYVLNMPLRIRKGQHPKYRMVHATNHVEGCLLMANNICTRWELMKNIQTGGQMSLFQEDVDNNIIDEPELSTKIENHIKKYVQFEQLNVILAEFFMINGPICSTGKVNDVFRNMENSGKIEVVRRPATTPSGKISKFFADGKGKTTILRLKT